MIYEIVMDAGETANKCTIAPLSDRADFKIIRVRGEGPIGPLQAPLLLHHEGQCLSELRARFASVPALASIDCVWRRLVPIQSRLVWAVGQPILARIPDGFKTVYPRVSAKNTDPDGGLATIEAIFVAAALLGKWDLTLLAKYYFGRAFIEKNTERFKELGVYQPVSDSAFSILADTHRTSMTRRQNRGRVPKTSPVGVGD